MGSKGGSGSEGVVRTDEHGVRVGGTWLRRTSVALLVVLCFGSVLAPASATTVDQRTSPLPNAIGGQRPSSLNERPQGFTAHGFGPLDVVSVDLLLENGSFAPAPPVGPGPHNNQTPIGSRLPPGGMLLQSISAGECRYDQRVDRAHRSGTDVSTHGWWVNLGGTCPAMANVDTYLQAYWCGSYGCRWVTVSSDSRDVRAGDGVTDEMRACRVRPTAQPAGGALLTSTSSASMIHLASPTPILRTSVALPPSADPAELASFVWAAFRTRLLRVCTRNAPRRQGGRARSSWTSSSSREGVIGSCSVGWAGHRLRPDRMLWPTSSER